MKNSNTVAAQFIKLIPRGEFNKLAKQHHNGQAFRKFTRFDQFICLLTMQVTGRQSIRDIVENFKVQASKLYHLGIHLMTRSSLSRINSEQPYEFYEALFYKLSMRCKPLSGKHKFKFSNPLYSMDASTIDLCLSVFPWAKFRKTKGAVKLHAVINHDGLIPEFIDITDGKTHEVNMGKKIKFPKGSIVAVDRGYIDYEWFNELTEKGVFFVSRCKSNMKYKVVKRNSKIKSKGITSDQYVELTTKKGELYQGTLRRVGYKDLETGKKYYFITNNKYLCAKTIADIYKDRWQIELFFKWVKQNLKIKKFIGTSKNAVMSQIWVAMCTYILIEYFRWSNGIKKSALSVIHLMQLCWFERRSLVELFVLPDSSSSTDNTQLELEGFMGH